MTELAVGAEIEVEVGSVAHGGHMVARHDGRVVFVRHALPGERVRARLTEGHGRYLRADAVAILEASPHRVPAPCPLARPGGCGGCDFQHVSLDEQRRLKAEVVREQLRRLAGLDREVVCEPVPGDLPENDRGLRWRTRMQYVGLTGGRLGLRAHRSHEVIPVEDCLIEHPGARRVVGDRVARERGGSGRARSGSVDAGPVVTEQVLGRSLRVAPDGFWQVHPGAPRVLVETVLGMLRPQLGERVVDLYAGVGLFSVFLAAAVGPDGSVLAVEGDRAASRLATENLAECGWARARAGRVERVLRGLGGIGVDLVVLDPPRSGARRGVVDAVTALAPRAIAYVACDPAALARDLAYAADRGYRLADLRVLDLFPMTHHVECVALIVPR